MKFIKSSLDERTENLRKYTSGQERNALLIDEDKPLEDVLSELSDVKIEREGETSYFILKLREISVSDVVEMLVTCQECQTLNEKQIKISEFINDEEYKFKGETLPRGFFTEPEEVINTDDLENLSWNDYTDLENLIRDQTVSMFRPATRSCRKCNNELNFFLNPRDAFSKSSIKSIFQEYTDISMYSHNGKLDIDSMYPFERAVMLSLIIGNLNSKE